MNTSTITSFLRFLRQKPFLTPNLVVSKQPQFRLISNYNLGQAFGVRLNHVFTRSPMSQRFSSQKRLLTSQQPENLRRLRDDFGPHILSAELSQDNRSIIVKMGDDEQENSLFEVQEFPFVWLRDNCQCQKCFHPEALSRTLPMLKFDLNCRPTSHRVSEDKSTLTLTWEDGHQSAFEADWLNERAFTPRARVNRLSNYRGNRVLWDAKDFARISDNTNMSESSWRFPFDDILSKESSLLAWLEYLENWGIAMVVGAEPCNGQLRKLAERVAFVRRTHYGELFSVRAKDEPSNVAYTSDKLQLHTDLPYYEYKPGVNMLQCIVQWSGPGGENHLVDSFAVAELMRQEHPKEYEILSKTIVDWVDIGKEPVGEDDGSLSAVKQERKAFHSIYRAPVICEDRDGYIVRVNVSQPQRDSHFGVNLSSVLPWYKAFNLFAQLLHSQRFLAIYKLKPGDILTFDNLRICHGREAYGMNESSPKVIERHVKGAYMDWDEVRSRIRTLRKALNA